MKRSLCTSLLPLFTACTLIATAACKDSGTGLAGDEAAVITFSYSGDRSGSYQARGEISLDANRRPEHGTFAAALPEASGDIGVAGARAQTAPLADIFILGLHNISEPGTYPIREDCTPQSTLSCALGYLAFGYHWEDQRQPPAAQYFLDSGTVTISELSGDRIRGTFQAEESSFLIPSLSISDGSFDVPIVPNTTPIRRSRSGRGGLLESLLPPLE